ncbi:hypothetical protein D3C85_1422530 [compost metagenome]
MVSVVEPQIFMARQVRQDVDHLTAVHLPDLVVIEVTSVVGVPFLFGFVTRTQLVDVHQGLRSNPHRVGTVVQNVKQKEDPISDLVVPRMRHHRGSPNLRLTSNKSIRIAPW